MRCILVIILQGSNNNKHFVLASFVSQSLKGQCHEMVVEIRHWSTIISQN
jgi:hypothetical protein